MYYVNIRRQQAIFTLYVDTSSPVEENRVDSIYITLMLFCVCESRGLFLSLTLQVFMFFHVYLLRSKIDNSFYIGFAENLKDRMEKHSKGMVQSTKNLRPMELIYFESYKSKKDALIREKRLKQFAKGFASLKQRIVNSLILEG